jgi:hypothetical protein
VENPIWRANDLRILHEFPNLNASLGSAPLSALLYPAFFTNVWAALYVIAGILINTGTRGASAFAWFKQTFDIEKKPLQAIGVLAGSVVALLYWSAVVVRSFSR